MYSTSASTVFQMPSPMDQDQTHGNPPNTVPSNSAGRRRARSTSQPVPSHPVPGPSNIPYHFGMQNQFAPMPPAAPAQMFPSGYDEAAFSRALLTLQGNAMTPHDPQQPLGPPLMPPMQQPQANMVNPAQALLAALPLLQMLLAQNPQFAQQQPQLQQQFQQQSQQTQQAHHQQPRQQSHQQSQQNPYAGSSIQTQPPFPFGGSSYGYFPQQSPGPSHHESSTPSSPTDTGPAPETAEPTELDQTVIAEEKRRRNTAASARFRIKKKQWTLNLERTISDLSGRVEELEAEATELRRENGWLKEIVMLKSKRINGGVPDLASASTEGGSSSHTGGEPSNPPNDPDEQRESGGEQNEGSGKGKEREVP